MAPSPSKDLISLFQYYAKQQPAATALEDESYTLTYAELDQWSNDLAYGIQSRLKNGSGTVAICMPRSALFVVSVIAIVKSGCSYLSLDPSAPSARLDDQIMQADAGLLVTVSSHQLPPLDQAVPLFDIVPFIERNCIRGITGLDKAISTSNTDLDQRNDTLVIFFTSGSTGQPKGARVRHEGVLNFVDFDLLSVQPGERVSFVNNPAFDASSIDIWNTLCHGGSLFVLTSHLADMESLVSFFRQNSITKALLPTGVFHQVTNDASNVAAIGESLRMLAVGGEALLPACVRTLVQHAPQTRLINVYGPTECCAFTTTIEATTPWFVHGPGSQAILVGCPIPNTFVHILDDDLHPVESGLPGEICISGKGVAAGYVGQDELTSKKFVVVENLDGIGSSTRIYRTGDLGRFAPSPDGYDVVLEFIGRNDNQKKVNGQRIELGEIEVILCSGSQIERAVVVLAEDGILVAYVVLKENVAEVLSNSDEISACGPDNGGLVTMVREHCQRKLPPYMVPGHIIITRDFPLTANGKVDRKKLAQPEMWDPARKDESGPATQPENDIEARLQICVGQVLGEEHHQTQIPLTTNFVALGLHSFRAPKLLKSLRIQFSLPDLHFSAINEYPNVKALSAHLEDLLSTVTPANETTLLKTDARREVPYDHDALRQVLEYRGFTMEDVEDVYETTTVQKIFMFGTSACGGMTHHVATARTDVDTFVKAIETVISHHTALRSTVFDNLGRQVVFRYDQRLRDQMIHIHPAEKTLESIVKDESRYCLKPPGPLITFELFCTTPPTLLILAHHAVMDAWSREGLFCDLDHAISGKSLPEPAPFRDYVDYYVAHSNNPEYVAWHVDRIREVEVAPFPSSNKTSFQFSCYFGPHFMRVEHIPELQTVSKNYNIKISTLMKLAFALVRRHETKNDTVFILQTEVGRSLPVKGITDMCAPAVNTLIDRIDFTPGSSVLDLLHTTQRNQDKITETSVVDILPVLHLSGKHQGTFTSCIFAFTQHGTSVYDVLQPGPMGGESFIGMEWTAYVDGDLVKVRVDHDPVFADRIPGYVAQFYKVGRWLAANIEAGSIDGLEL